MAPRRAAAAADPSSSTEEDGDTSSSDSPTSHEQEVADDESGGKELEGEKPESESEEGEPESESEEEEWEATAEVEKDEESTEEGDEEEEEDVDFQPLQRIDPPLTVALKDEEDEEEEEEDEEDVDFQPIKRMDHRAPLLPAEAEEPAGKNQSPARGRKRASGEIGRSLSPGARPQSEKTAQHCGSSERKSKRIRRVWAPDDEVLILVSLAQHRRQHGELPAWGDFGFFESIRERLEENSCHRTEIKDKVRSLHRRYISGAVSTTDHDRRLHKLSEDVWGDLPSSVAATGPINGKKQADGMFAMSGAENAMPGAENGGRESDTKDFKEMCEMYPLLAKEVNLLAGVQPGLESSFTRLDAKRALDIEKKLERVKYAELKIETRMVLEVHAPKAKIKKKLVSLLAKVSKNV